MTSHSPGVAAGAQAGGSTSACSRDQARAAGNIASEPAGSASPQQEVTRADSSRCVGCSRTPAGTR